MSDFSDYVRDGLKTKKANEEASTKKANRDNEILDDGYKTLLQSVKTSFHQLVGEINDDPGIETKLHLHSDGDKLILTGNESNSLEIRGNRATRTVEILSTGTIKHYSASYWPKITGTQTGFYVEGKDGPVTITITHPEGHQIAAKAISAYLGLPLGFGN